MGILYKFIVLVWVYGNVAGIVWEFYGSCNGIDWISPVYSVFSRIFWVKRIFSFCVLLGHVFMEGDSMLWFVTW